MALTFNPVFIIALGGTGSRVAELLRDRLEWRYGDAQHIPFVRFLFVDTDHNNPNAAGPDGVQINPPSGQIERMLSHPEEFDHVGLKDWIDMEALKRADKGGFQQGAAGVRMFGRLAFFSAQAFGTMWRQIGQKIVEVSRVTDRDVKSALGLDPNTQVTIGTTTRCYVVSSACGGTGSGIFIDVGYMLHAILEKEQVAAERVGILAIARQDARSERQYARNTAAILSELDFYNRSGVVYEAKFPQQPPLATRAAAYDYCYLVSPSGATGEMDFDVFLHKIAEYIYMEVIAQTREAQSRRVDFGPDMAEYDMDGYPLRFLTFGISSVEFPADVCHKACYYGTIASFVETWLQTDDRRIATDGTLPVDPSSQDLHELMGRFGVGAVRPQDDRLLEELTRVPEDLATVAGGMRPQDWINDHIRRTFEGELSAEAFTDLEQKLESAVGKEGYLPQCVTLNTRRLRGQRTLETDLLTIVLGHCFNLAKGPRYALGLVREFQKALTEELARIDAELRTPMVPVYTLEDAAAAVEAIRRDWLLRLPPLIGSSWINEHAARREMEKPRVLICDAYNRRVEQIILTAKRQLLAELLDLCLRVLERRLGHLLEYLVAWHGEAINEYKAIMERPLDRRTAMLFSEQVVQLKMERVMKDVDEGTRDKFLRSLLDPERTGALREALQATLDRDESRPFTADVPRDASRGGGVQLEYVDGICTFIRDRYRQQAPSGQPPIIYDERVIERFQEAAIKTTGLPSEVALLVTESLELAQLNLSHPKYVDIQPVNPRDGWWAFFRGAQAPGEWREFKQQLTNAANAAVGTHGLHPPDPSRWLQEIEDPYMMVLLRERAAFPTRIILGYDIAEREEKIAGTRAGVGRVEDITAFSRTGVRPTPPGERDIREAEQFLLGAILLGMLEYSQQHQEFSMELAQIPGTPRRLLTLPTDFGIAVSELAYRTETRTTLGQMLEDKINQMGKDEVRNIMAGVKGRIQVADDGKPRTNEMGKLGVRGLDDAQADNILRGFEAHFGLVSEEQAADAVHPYAELVLDPPRGRRPGYYCRNAGCGIFLGTEVDAIPPHCPHCGRSFVPRANT